MSLHAAGFDRVAAPYQLLEYLTMGKVLENTRFHFLHQIKDARNALVLGDGDGRFLAKLFSVNPAVHVTAVDSSGEMLRLLQRRCQPYADRLTAVEGDALSSSVEANEQYDLVTTHFFLDCLRQEEIESLTQQLRSHLAPGAVWIVSEFRIASGAMRLPSWLMVRFLYLTFRILTGLRTSRLPDYASALSQAGFVRRKQQLFLAGILTSELWQLP